MNTGIVYALKNKAMPGLVKIGKTSDLDSRLSQLYNTSVPYPFECIYAVECDMDKVERTLHEEIFYEERVNPRREFFAVAPDKVIGVLSLLGKNVTEKVQAVMREESSELEGIVASNEMVFYLKCKECFAVMSYENGKCILKKGSQIRHDSVPSIIPSIGSKREELLKSPKVETREGTVYLTENLECTSPSLAGAFASGRNTNGQKEWKTEEGVSFREVVNFEE